MNRRMRNMFIFACLAWAVLVSARPAAAETVKLNQGEPVKRIVPDTQISDNDTLFKEYVEKKMYTRTPAKSKRKMATRSRRLTLDETDRTIYDLLRAEISKAADGELDSSVFTISLKDVFGDEVNSAFTAEELGVDASDDDVIQKCVDAFYDRFTINEDHLVRIIECLLVDCPYELYWYDKTEGVCITYPDVYETDERSEWAICFDDDPVQNIVFACSPDYSDGTYEYIDGYYSRILTGLNTEKTGKVNTSVQTARTGVDIYKGEDDFTKLSSYRDWICNEVSYDYDAAKDDDIPYGDPWQLISVFDNDPDTNVVCEGYAKAFQYLCDLSVFQSDAVEAFTVTGDFTYSGGGGGHMWNIVTMDDHHNYLVDVTNCDTDTEEMDLGFFLAVPAEGDLSEGYYFEIDGVLYTYIYDEDTLKLYKSDLETLTMSAGAEPFKYCSHTSVVPIEGNKATCTESGLTEGSKCTICNRILHEQEVIPAAHTPVVLSAVPPTCTEPGLTEGSKCSVCNEILISQEAIEPSGHHWDDGVITKEATAEEEGEKEYTCTVCGEKKIEAIKKLTSVPDNDTTSENQPAASASQPGHSSSPSGTPGTWPSTRPSAVKVSAITIDGISKKLAPGTKVQLTAALKPANATIKTLTWTSSNKKVATVNQKGLVKIMKNAGGKKVTITATAADGSGKKAVWKIKVMKGIVKKVTVKGAKASLKAGKTMKLKAAVKAGKGANKSVRWISVNEEYATVSSSGKVKALKAGKGKKVKIIAMATDGSGKKKVIQFKIK
ncbi:MAG: Ig-like domain-containing protein [Eubacterium sp.]|nr:Ig-like domain-containing protein [Eubacterium sp.]